MVFSVSTAQILSQDQVQQRDAQKSFFPNQASLGSFTPHSTIVEIGCFRTQRVIESICAGNLINVRKDIQVLCHEMTHWFDFFGTIWGRDYIKTICRAYRSLGRASEVDFPHL